MGEGNSMKYSSQAVKRGKKRPKRKVDFDDPKIIPWILYRNNYRQFSAGVYWKGCLKLR